MSDRVRFDHHDAAGARSLRETVSLVHRDAYADIIAYAGPFESPETFMQRFESHSSRPGFGYIIAYIDDEPVGQTWGLTKARPTFGDAEPTFGLCEIMVRKTWTGRGIAHALHDELLKTRAEAQAELYVRPENTRAYRAYLRWGWHKAGETRPDLPDAPVFDVLILPLPLPAEARQTGDVGSRL